jgi:hypothetical protein
MDDRTLVISQKKVGIARAAGTAVSAASLLGQIRHHHAVTREVLERDATHVYHGAAASGIDERTCAVFQKDCDNVVATVRTGVKESRLAVLVKPVRSGTPLNEQLDNRYESVRACSMQRRFIRRSYPVDVINALPNEGFDAAIVAPGARKMQCRDSCVVSPARIGTCSKQLHDQLIVG